MSGTVDPPKAAAPKRRRWQFGLRALFVVITLAAIGFGTLGVRWYRSHLYERATLAIRDAGGRIAELENHRKRVYLSGKELDDARLEELLPHLLNLHDLDRLDLVKNRITDAGLAKLARLKRLKVLYLFETQATKAGIARLGRDLPELTIREELPDPIAMGLAMTPIYRHAVMALALAPDGRSFVTGSADGALRWWTSGDELAEIVPSAHADWLFGAAYSPSGELLATGGGDNLIHLWDTQSRALVDTLIGHTGDVHAVAFASGDVLISAGDDRTIRIWDLPTRSLRHTLSAHERPIPILALSPDSSLVYSGSRDGTIGVWRVATGELVRRTRCHDADVISIALRPDGQQLATASYDGTIALWNATSGDLEQRLIGHRDWVLSVGYDSSGTRLASASRDKTLRIWDLTRGVTTEILPDQGLISRTVFDPRSQRLITTSAEGQLCFRDSNTGKTLASRYLGLAEFSAFETLLTP